MTALPLLSSCESELYFYTFIEEAQTKLRVGCGVTTVLTSAEPPVPRVWVEVGWASGIVRFVFYSGVFFIQLWGTFTILWSRTSTFFLQPEGGGAAACLPPGSCGPLRLRPSALAESWGWCGCALCEFGKLAGRCPHLSVVRRVAPLWPCHSL